MGLVECECFRNDMNNYPVPGHLPMTFHFKRVTTLPRTEKGFSDESETEIVRILGNWSVKFSIIQHLFSKTAD